MANPPEHEAPGLPDTPNPACSSDGRGVAAALPPLCWGAASVRPTSPFIGEPVGRSLPASLQTRRANWGKRSPHRPHHRRQGIDTRAWIPRYFFLRQGPGRVSSRPTGPGNLSLMEGEALPQVMGPAPRLILAMAQHPVMGRRKQARKTLAMAIVGFRLESLQRRTAAVSGYAT